jgi:hypothetical protein
MAKLTTFMAVLLIAAADVASIPSAQGIRTLDTVEDVNLPVVAASSPTAYVNLDVPPEEAVADGPTTAPAGPVDYDDKTPLLGPVLIHT